MHQCLKFICFGMTLYMFTANSQQYLFNIRLLLYVQSWTPEDGQKDRQKHVECHSKINKFDTLVHLIGFTIELSYHAYHQCPISSKLWSPYTTCSTNWSLIRKPQKATSITPAAKNAWKATPTTVLFEGPTISIAEKGNKKILFLQLH